MGKLTIVAFHLLDLIFRLVDWVLSVVFNKRLTALTEESLLKRFTDEEKYGENGLFSTAAIDNVWYDGYRVILKCFREDRGIHAFGRKFVENHMSRLLQNRLLIYKALCENYTYDFKIVRPIFLIGPMRSGTTFLQKLLALDDRNTSPLFYELSYPFGEPNREEMSKTAIDFLNAVYPSFRIAHDVKPDEPNECYHILEHSSITKHLLICSQNYSEYEAWLRERSTEEMVNVYRFHKKQLQLILRSRPGQKSKQRLVLKDSIHSSYLEAILAVYPDAIFIHTYRNPISTVGSCCSLVVATLNLYFQSGRMDLQEIGRHCLKCSLFNGGNEFVKFRKGHPELEEKFIDVQYNELEEDPIRVVRMIYKRLGISMTDAALRNFEIYIKDNPRHKHGVHKYNLQKYGVTDAEVLNRFKEYIEYFEN